MTIANLEGRRTWGYNVRRGASASQFLSSHIAPPLFSSDQGIFFSFSHEDCHGDTHLLVLQGSM